MSIPTRGYLTLAAGDSRYLEMAVDMALSLREHTGHPIGLVCDEDGVVTGLVPGSAADVQVQYDARTKRELRIKSGDRIVCIDGTPLDGQGMDDVIRPADQLHVGFCCCRI